MTRSSNVESNFDLSRRHVWVSWGRKSSLFASFSPIAASATSRLFSRRKELGNDMGAVGKSKERLLLVVHNAVAPGMERGRGPP